MMHVATDGKAFFIKKFKTKDIQQINGTLAMMMITDFIIPFQFGGAEVVEEGNDTATIVWQVWSYLPHFAIYSQRVICQTTYIPMVVMAMGREIVAVFQIGYHIVHSPARDIT
ncbi:MAG: hypothetical protein J6I31_03135 [Prevotella sp.]|nr:hypothetical protein [Prevotella sp.]